MKLVYSRIIGINFILIILATISIRLLKRYDELGYALIMAVAIAVQMFINLLFAIFQHDSDARLAHLLSFLLLLLIGFGACMAGASIRF